MTGDPKMFKFTEDKTGGKAGKEGEKAKAKVEEEDEEEGALCDVAPTVLALLGLDQPEGELLLSRLVFPQHVSI